MSRHEESNVEFLRQDEMVELIWSEKNLITHQLMAEASNTIFKLVLSQAKGPIADFDLLYFMEVMREFCGQHGLLKMILEGKGHEIPEFPTE